MNKSIWQFAFGMQAVDGLEPSEYILHLIEAHNPCFDEFEKMELLVKDFYAEKESVDRQYECDMVALHMAEYCMNIVPGKVEMYAEKMLQTDVLKKIHRKLFGEVFDFAGMFRKYNISKDEPVLGGQSIKYADYRRIEDYMRYDFAEEQKQCYTDKNLEEVISRISKFSSHIWQIHAFMEGNTRTVAVYMTEYLCCLGYAIDWEYFGNNAVGFRNALVKANYADYTTGIQADTTALEGFWRNAIQTNYQREIS